MLRQGGAILLLICASSIGVIAREADIQMSNVCLFGIIEETKSTMASDATSLIDEASLNNEGFVSRDDAIVDQFFIHLDAKLRGTESRCWENDARQNAGGRVAAFSQVFSLFSGGSAIPFFGCARNEGSRIKDKGQGRLFPGILIFNDELVLLASGRLAFKLSVARADPSSLRLDHGLVRAIGLFGGNVSLFSRYFGLSSCRVSGAFCGIRGCFSGFGLCFDRFVNLDHLVDLITDGSKSHSYQDYRYPFSKLLSAILALFFFPVGAAFALYGVNESRKIGGWAAFLVFLELPFFAVALWVFFEGVLGWDVRHVSHTLNRGPENIIVKPTIIPELELRNVKWHVFPANLVERADDAALENRPEAFNRLGMNGTDDELMLGMVNSCVREFLSNVTAPLIDRSKFCTSRQEADNRPRNDVLM
jgi:hypothetical protein